MIYARKSSESEERRVLSIDSQIQEMLRAAEKEGLEIVDIRRESHSAKDSGQRPVFNEILNDIKTGKFTGILTWAPDRLSRNAGDLGSLVDLMDQKLLIEIRTTGQRFANNPNEKFLLKRRDKPGNPRIRLHKTAYLRTVRIGHNCRREIQKAKGRHNCKIRILWLHQIKRPALQQQIYERRRFNKKSA